MAKPPESVVSRVEKRIKEHVQKHWSKKVESFTVRARGSFVYIDARFVGLPIFEEDDDGELEPLCRLRYLGREDEWEFAFFSCSRGNRGAYELSYLNNGQPFGTPEECFDCAAFVWR